MTSILSIAVTHKCIPDILLVVNERVLPEVKQLLAGKDLPSLGDDMNIEYISLGNAADEWGTADVLRHIEAKIKVDASKRECYLMLMQLPM
uniref:Uncharacterized protein n=1 Tax=Parascaris equorum TaxID=6256 RepID=A0A914S401_PAREQ